MNQTSVEKFDIRDELRVIPKAMGVVAALLFVGLQALMLAYLFRRDPHAPPVALQVPIAFLAGSVVAFFILLIGYVNRDAKRRGMNPVFWTVLVLLVPDAIGFIIYFVVRQPIWGTCPGCGARVNPAFNYCPKCKFNLHPACPECHRAIEPGATFCPYCGAELKALR